MVARVKVVHASNDGVFDVPVRTPVRVVRASLVDAFNIPETALSLVNGRRVAGTYDLLDNDTLEFMVAWGLRSSHDSILPEQGRLLTVKEAAAELRCSISFVCKLMSLGQISYECRGAAEVAVCHVGSRLQAAEHPPGLTVSVTQDQRLNPSALPVPTAIYRPPPTARRLSE